MDQHLAPPPADAARTASHPRPPRAHWTPAKQRIFLVALGDSGSVAHAARAAGMSPSSANRLRARLRGTPFDRTWTHVLALHARRLADPFAPDPMPGGRAADASPARGDARGARG